MSDKSIPANIGPVVSGKAVELMIKFAEFGLYAEPLLTIKDRQIGIIRCDGYRVRHLDAGG